MTQKQRLLEQDGDLQQSFKTHDYSEYTSTPSAIGKPQWNTTRPRDILHVINLLGHKKNRQHINIHPARGKIIQGL